MDTIEHAQRSRIMARVRSQHTRPEVVFRRALHRLGLRYRMHVRGLPGKPDLVFPRFMAVVFVHGCFWHQHGCHRSKRPTSNRDYWDRKLDGNLARDTQNQARLRELGWTVMTIWECSLQHDTERTLRFLKLLRGNLHRGISPATRNLG